MLFGLAILAAIIALGDYVATGRHSAAEYDYAFAALEILLAYCAIGLRRHPVLRILAGWAFLQIAYAALTHRLY